jgi:hypothetical protein
MQIVISVERRESELWLKFDDGLSVTAMPFTVAAARQLAADLWFATAAVDPAGHRALLDQAAGELVADALLARAPVNGSH